MRNGSDPHVREEFRSRGGGGGLTSLARIFSPLFLPENQVVLPEYYLLFYARNCYI